MLSCQICFPTPLFYTCNKHLVFVINKNCQGKHTHTKSQQVEQVTGRTGMSDLAGHRTDSQLLLQANREQTS